jgi:hypothetical protein
MMGKFAYALAGCPSERLAQRRPSTLQAFLVSLTFRYGSLRRMAKLSVAVLKLKAHRTPFNVPQKE